LAGARAAVLLISADFFASDFIAAEELPPLLEDERKRGLLISGVHIGPSRFDRDRVLSAYQTINSPDRPIESLSKADQDAVFDALARRHRGSARFVRPIRASRRWPRRRATAA
jgi:hypothetical protein